MQISSFAKINLGLRILGKRNDGFHELETIFQTISVHDDLEFYPADKEITLKGDSPGCSSEHNLVYKAALLLKQHCSIEQGCIIKLDKRIPVGAGLGGGSSNAATTLIALNNLWNIGLKTDSLLSLAAQLGSDVPFFIIKGTALGQGRGEILTPLDFSLQFHGVLVCPDLRIITKTAYEMLNFSLTKSFKKSKFSVLTRWKTDYKIWNTQLVNDFEPVIFNAYPELSQIFQDFKKQDAFYSRMSGSGSTMFGLFENEEKAVKARQYFQKKYKTFIFTPLYQSTIITESG